jgi:hypothetical protein
MHFDDLNNSNFILYAAKCYEKPNVVLSEFKDDMKRFNYLKRLFHKYRKDGELREQLILNHLVVLYNVFGPEPTVRMLFFKMSTEDYSALKTYLLFLNIMPDVVRGIKEKDIRSSNIEVDFKIVEALRKIK